MSNYSKMVLHYPQFAPILNDYLSLPEFHDKANETMRAKRVTTTSLCNYLGDIGITSFQDCSPNDVTQFLESISYLASSTKSGRLFILRHFFNYLYRKKTTFSYVELYWKGDPESRCLSSNFT